MQVADPEDACTNISMPVLDSKPWIALIVRSERARKDCSFDVKVTIPDSCYHPTAVQLSYASADYMWMAIRCPSVQVKYAQDAGAVAAIVYDDVYEALIIMSKPRDHEDPGIPAVFVAQKTGIVMKKLMSPGITVVRITPVGFQLVSALLSFGTASPHFLEVGVSIITYC